MDPRQKKTVSLLLGIIAVLVAALLIVLGVKAQKAKEAEEAAAQRQATGGVITERHAYTALSYHNGSATLSFAVDESGKWTWADDPDFPLDDATVTGIVETLAALKPQQTITDGDTLESYGLDQPSVTLTATAESGAQLTLAFGRATTDGNSYYMLKNGEETPVYIVAGTLLQLLRTPIYDMCALPELPVLDESSIDDVFVSAGETKASFSAVRPKSAEEPEEGEDAPPAPVPVTWTSGGKDVTDSAAVIALLDALKDLAFERCVDYRPSDEAASICGFDAPAAQLTVAYHTETGERQELTLSIGTKAHEADGYYARWNDDATVYLLSAALAEPVLSAAANGL